MRDNSFDRTIRCEFDVDLAAEAEAVLGECGWRWTAVAPCTYQVDVAVRGGARGAARYGRRILLTKMRRHGLEIRLRSVRTLRIAPQAGDHVQVYEVRGPTRLRLERILVASGMRDIGAWVIKVIC